MGENMEELKEVLERVEGKLIAAEKIYLALQFQVWVVIMTFYYLIIGPLKTVPWQLAAVYWTLALVVFAYFTGLVWKKLSMLYLASNKTLKTSRAFGASMALSWVVGAIVGGILIPKYTPFDTSPQSKLAVGYLTFIGLAVFGMFITFMHFAKKVEKEMIPAFLVPGLAIPIIPKIAEGAMAYAGFAVALGFTLTVFAYIYNAFKILG